VRKPKEYRAIQPGDLVQVDTLDVRPLQWGGRTGSPHSYRGVLPGERLLAGDGGSQSRAPAVGEKPTTPCVLTSRSATSHHCNFFSSGIPNERPECVTHLLDEFMLLYSPTFGDIVHCVIRSPSSNTCLLKGHAKQCCVPAKLRRDKNGCRFVRERSGPCPTTSLSGSLCRPLST
jgi:hypothetical protein